MKYQKKSLWVLVSAGMLSLAFVSGCADEDKGSKGTKGGTGTTERPGSQVTPGGDKYNLRKWGKVDAAAVANANNFGIPVASKDGNWLYVDSSKGLQAADLSDFDAGVKGKWSANLIKPTGTGLKATTPGQAELIANKEAGVGDQPYHPINIRAIQASDKGAVVSIEKGVSVKTDPFDFGIISFEGNTIKNAWKGEAPDILTGNAAADVIKKDMVIYPYVLASSTGDQLYVTTRKGYDYIGLGALGSNPIDKAVRGPLMEAGDVGWVAGWGRRHQFMNPWLAQEKAGEPAYIVDQKGVRVIPADKVGAAYDFAITANEFKELSDNPKAGSKKWGGEGEALLDVVMAAGKVYIAVANGKVAVYDTKAPGIVVDAKTTWTGFKNFAVDGDAVWAVFANALVAVSADGKKGEAMGVKVQADKREKDVTYDETDAAGTILPNTGITGAVFAKGNLVISTTGGIYFYTKTKEDVKK